MHVCGDRERERVRERERDAIKSKGIEVFEVALGVARSTTTADPPSS